MTITIYQKKKQHKIVQQAKLDIAITIADPWSQAKVGQIIKNKKMEKNDKKQNYPNFHHSNI